MTQRRSKRLPKVKVTVSIDSGILRAVDAFVAETKIKGHSRSAVFEEALKLWQQKTTDEFDAQYYASEADALKADNESWTAITTESAKRIWNALPEHQLLAKTTKALDTRASRLRKSSGNQTDSEKRG